MTLKYSRLGLAVNVYVSSMCGFFVGGAEGLIGSMAIPTSVRHLNESLDGIVDDVLGEDGIVDDAEETPGPTPSRRDQLWKYPFFSDAYDMCSLVPAMFTSLADELPLTGRHDFPGVYDKVREGFYHGARLVTRIGVYGAAIQGMVQGLTTFLQDPSKADESAIGYTFLLLPNLVSGVYESRRLFKNPEVKHFFHTIFGRTPQGN